MTGFTFRYLYFLTQNFKLLVILCNCTARFASDLIGTPKKGYIVTPLTCTCLVRVFDRLVWQQVGRKDLAPESPVFDY